MRVLLFVVVRVVRSEEVLDVYDNTVIGRSASANSGYLEAARL